MTDEVKGIAAQHSKLAEATVPEPAAAPNLVVASRQEAQEQLVAERQRVADLQRVTQEIFDGRARQQATIARLALEALASRELNGTLELLAREAGTALAADFVSVLEVRQGRSTFALRADFGWPSGVVSPTAVCALGEAQAQFTLRTTAAVVSPDLRGESRFTVAPMVLQHGAVSGMSVIVPGKKEPWGVVGVHTKARRNFTDDDVHFVQAVANLMALAIERERVETALRQRNRQQAAVAMLGRRALAGPHMDDFFGDAVRDVAATLEVDVCELLQRNGDEGSLLLRAGVGWQAGLVGTARVSSGINSQAAYTLNSQGPVIFSDLAADARFQPSSILHDHGVVSGMSVLVPGRNRPFGILGAHCRSPRSFSQDDSNFLHSVANLLAAAIERHRVEHELRRHRDDLEGLVEERTALLAASNRELEAFSYTISHDLRAPLRSINGLSKILQRKHGDALPVAAQEILKLMADETIRMGNLIESILSLSRLGRVSLLHAPVDISAMATAFLKGQQTAEPSRNVEWTVDPGLAVVGDEGLVRILVENLLGNAWKFTGQTNPARITVSREPNGFLVQDNGAGFDMAHARELFQPFHRLHAPDEFEGTGIGLATVSRIVGRHGGRVWAQGVPGQGATFHVMLPPEAPHAKSPEHGSPMAAQGPY